MNNPDKNAAACGPLFRPLRDEPRLVRVELDGETVMARERDTVASLLLGSVAPDLYRRSAASGLPRAPLCMMGVCFECLVEIDGQTNQQGCLVRVRDGMRIRRQVPGAARP
jgi:predicted molibdopterin-dependent oxidoreductase YjgC